MSCQAKNSSLHVLLMPSEINEHNQFGRSLTYFLSTDAHGIVHNLTLGIKTKDLVTDRGRPTRLDLVQVTEQVQSSPAPPIVHLSLGQHPQQSAFSGLHWTKHSQTQVQEWLVIRNLAYQDFTDRLLVLLILFSGANDAGP